MNKTSTKEKKSPEDLLKEYKDQYKIIDLFPYKIKNVNNFINRNHPVNLHPSASKYKSYWRQCINYSIEGKWVNDEGTYIWMMPKLWWYININKIPLTDKISKTRLYSYPDLADTEWLFGSYLTCCIGFSGFKDDTNSCHKFLLNNPTIEECTEHCTKQNPETKEWFFDQREFDNLVVDGKIKTYINQWAYLTTYMTNKPLGVPLYYNQAQNGGMLTSRGTGKSEWLKSDVVHEWVTGGVKYKEDWKLMAKNSIEMWIGSAQADKTNDLIKKIKKSYDNLPGEYDNGITYYPSPFLKITTGSWSTDNKKGIQHLYKDANNMTKGSASQMKFGTITTENPEGAVGMRCNRISLEEIGLMNNYLEAHANNVNSLSTDGYQFGVEFCVGTGGSLDKIQDVKKVFYDPEAYDFMSIPNYWENKNKDTWLFIPVLYTHRDCKDRNGNTDFDKVLNKVIKIREKKKRAQDLHAYEKELMFNPLVPAEIFISAKFNLFPKVQLAERINYLEQFSTPTENIELIRNKEGVQRISTDKIPIQEFPMKESTEDKEGAIIIYEHPLIEHTNRNLYKVVYDPVKDEGEGTSLASVLVYKDYHSLGTIIDDYNVPDNSYNGTIVAEWVGRFNLPEHNHEQAFMLTEYYQGLLYPETNVGQINVYARNKNYTHLLGRAPKAAMSKDLKNPKFKSDIGVSMNKQLKDAAERYAKSWFLSKRPDGSSQIDHIHSLRLLREAIAYDRTGNFDHISSLFVLMFVINNSIEEPVYQIKQARAKKSSEDLFNFIQENTTYGSYN